MNASDLFAAARGLPPLRRDTRLDRSAALFSRYMGEANFFEHVGPDGVQPGQRMETQGYDWSWWGENIAWGYRSPQDVVEGWMASPGHRANILNPKFADLGVGIAFVNGTPYMTQDFGTLRRGAPADRLAATSSPRERIKPALKPPAKAPAKAATAPAANPATRAKKKGVATGRS